MGFIVKTDLFQAEGAYLNWAVVARRLGVLENRTSVPNLGAVLQLRWTLKDELGLPTEPFIVWRRERKLRAPKPINAEISSLPFLFGSQLVDLRGSYSVVDLIVSGGGGVVYAFVGKIFATSVVAIASIPAGNNVAVSLSAPAMEGLVISDGVTINSIQGVGTNDLSAAAGWREFEHVGLPVKKAPWAGQGIGKHGTDQGMVGAFTDAISAAKQRLERGAPPFGWSSAIAPGVVAPPWSAPQTSPLIQELNAQLLEDLRSIAGLAPATHKDQRISKTLPMPENSSGQHMSGSPGTTHVQPLYATYMAAAVDCFNCLALGFGTAYTAKSSDAGAGPDVLNYDYMITARFEKGLDGHSSAAAYAALVPSPSQAIAPPIPANVAAQMMGNLRPLARDGAWRASERITWDRPVPIPLFRPRSFAFARAGVLPPEPAALLMTKRADGSPLPIAVNSFSTPDDPEPNRVSAVDREIPIPNQPGSRALQYAIAHQDIYGQWSKWVAVAGAITQPGVDEPRIVGAEFKYTNIPSPPNAKCAANLVLEFVWDWRVRTPLTISFRGRLHPAAYHGAPPPDVTLPPGLQLNLGMPPATTFTLHFDILAANGAPTSTWPGYNPLAHCVALNSAGDAQVTFGAAQGSDTRRYRVTIPGFELDFGPTGHIGLALWAQGQEAMAPQHFSAWSTQPSVISTSDPRPPLIAPDIVTLSSLPDAAGESHAILKWADSPGASGYFIYESSEARLRRAVGESEPDPALTLSQRLTHLRNLYDAQPLALRREFTRRNARLIEGTSSDITLPRGSTAIHLFFVLGVSAGQTEAAWPASSTALFAFAVPRVPKPGAPILEANAVLDTSVTPNIYRTRLRIQTRLGPRVQRVDVHRVRVDDAARELDTMGPPIVTVDSLTPGWQAPAIIDSLGANIPIATGTDTPTGSWKRVWYRAAAWSADDPLRGTLAARSPASTTAWVVIPPATPPDLSPLALEFSGTGPADARVTWSSAAPVAKTALGSHSLTIRAKRVGAPPDEPPLLAFDGALSALGSTDPASGSGAWRVEGSKPAQYRMLIKRADVNHAVNVTVRLTDPLGRSSERLLTIAPGPVLPDPVLGNFVLKPSAIPAGWVLTFASPTPLVPPVYTLRVTVSFPRPPGPLFPFPPPPIVQEMLLSAVPLDEPGPVPPGTDKVRIRRMPGAGPEFRYYVFVRVAFARIVVRLSAPDGRVVQQVQLPV